MRFTTRHGIARRIRIVAATALFAIVAACGDDAPTTSTVSTTQLGQATTTPESPTSSTEAVTTTVEPGTPPTSASGANELLAPPPTEAVAVPPTTGRAANPPPASTPKNCVIHLHGKGGNGSGTTTSGNVVQIFPDGNSTGWGGRQWTYASSADFSAARTVVANAASSAGCTSVVVNGFSNGGAFAAKLYCRGESLGGTLAGVVVDDPVPDHGTAGCAPAPGVRVALYWTGGLDNPAQPGWKCSEQDWTCEGGTTVGISAYGAAMKTTVKASPQSGHQPYTNPPEHSSWLGV